MTASTQHLDAAAFNDVLRGLCHAKLTTCDTPPRDGPAEPLHSVAYVERTLARHLRSGLAALCARMAEERTAVASQRLWDADGHLSEGYRPFNAPRWLGEWLQAHNEYCEAVPDDPRSLDWAHGVPWSQLSLDRQLALAFHHLDDGATGCDPRAFCLPGLGRKNSVPTLTGGRLHAGTWGRRARRLWSPPFYRTMRLTTRARFWSAWT